MALMNDVYSYIESNYQPNEPIFLSELSIPGMKAVSVRQQMQDRVKKHSRHIYDIYKLLQIVPQTDEFKALVKEVRSVRAMTNICPSAQPDVNVPEMLNFLIENEVYKDDYENITARIMEEGVNYDVAIEAIKKIAESGMFE